MKAAGPAFEVKEYVLADTPINSTFQFKTRSELLDKYKEIKDISLEEVLKLYKEVRKISSHY